MHSTNYSNTFISVADDCAAERGEVPPERPRPTIARMQYEKIAGHPYRYTSDEVIFDVHARKNGVSADAMDAEHLRFFAEGRACLRASPLVKRYGWGIHHDEDSRVALYSRDSTEDRSLSTDRSLKQVKAMRSSR